MGTPLEWFKNGPLIRTHHRTTKTRRWSTSPSRTLKMFLKHVPDSLKKVTFTSAINRPTPSVIFCAKWRTPDQKKIQKVAFIQSNVADVQPLMSAKVKENSLHALQNIAEQWTGKTNFPIYTNIRPKQVTLWISQIRKSYIRNQIVEKDYFWRHSLPMMIASTGVSKSTRFTEVLGENFVCK